MSWTPADDFDDNGNYAPGPYPPRERFTRCQPGCCGIGPRLCEEPRDPDDDLHEDADQ